MHLVYLHYKYISVKVICQFNVNCASGAPKYSLSNVAVVDDNETTKQACLNHHLKACL